MSIIDTGMENARKFISVVNRSAQDGRVVIIYAADKHTPWPWMRNPLWQQFVLLHLTKSGRVRHAEFHPADNVDGLCFSAISTAGDSRIEGLTLDETIEGKTPPSGRWARLRWMFTSLTMKHWV